MRYLFVKLQGYNRLLWLHLSKQASVEHTPKIACNSAEPEQAFLCPNLVHNPQKDMLKWKSLILLSCYRLLS
jgi:hypothetical protein